LVFTYITGTAIIGQHPPHNRPIIPTKEFRNGLPGLLFISKPQESRENFGILLKWQQYEHLMRQLNSILLLEKCSNGFTLTLSQMD